MDYPLSHHSATHRATSHAASHSAAHRAAGWTSAHSAKDMESGFKDNGYREGDYVTIIGWLKDMPEEMWQLDNKFELAMNNFLIEEEQQRRYERLQNAYLRNSEQVYAQQKASHC